MDTKKTVVMRLPVALIDRFAPYAHDDVKMKVLMEIAIEDYISKREARTRRAEAQKRKYDE